MRMFFLLFLVFLMMSCRILVAPTVWSPPPRVYCMPVEAVRVMYGQERYPNLVCYPGEYIRSLREHPNACLRRISVPLRTVHELANAPEGEELRRNNPNFLYNVLMQYFAGEYCPDGVSIFGGIPD